MSFILELLRRGSIVVGVVLMLKEMSKCDNNYVVDIGEIEDTDSDTPVLDNIILALLFIFLITLH